MNNQKTAYCLKVRDNLIFPNMRLSYRTSHPKVIKSIVLAGEKQMPVVMVWDEILEQEDSSKIGCMADVEGYEEYQNGVVQVELVGLKRVRILKVEEDLVEFEELPELIQDIKDVEALAYHRLLQDSAVGIYSEDTHKLPMSLKALLQESNLMNLSLSLIRVLLFSIEQKQKLLEANTQSIFYQTLGQYVSNELNAQLLKKELKEKALRRLDKQQKEYVLREQLKVIQEALHGEDGISETEEIKANINQLAAPQVVKDRLYKELKRLKHIGNMSPEGNIIRDYIQTVLSLPWEVSSESNVDLKKAKHILEEEHYGLQLVKERMLEYLAVLKMNPSKKGSILCLVGPPGTGKSSLARSLSHALDREFLRISLGGVRDEAEIRGHRKTYIGAMPGRLVSGLIQVKTSNPVICLDEIDKISSDYKGDVFSALLEVLDPEQNHSFRDNYLELPVDLSSCIFVATANHFGQIPPALADRMEVLELNSYTLKEKEFIAKKYLLPKQLSQHGLDRKRMTLKAKSLRLLIEGYTKEAGVRKLEQRLAAIVRKMIYEHVLDDRNIEKMAISEIDIQRLLGSPKFIQSKSYSNDEVGLVNGLAWTAVGGVRLPIEVNLMPGKGDLILTGQLGNVMRESARIALTYIRSIGQGYGLSPEIFKEKDIHIHIPEGAVPKDGPSAGIAMATGILSAFTNRKVDAKMAMTGELTIRGHVLAIGGLKEKLLAADKSQIKTVFVPKENEALGIELMKELDLKLEIVYVDKGQEVFERILKESK